MADSTTPLNFSSIAKYFVHAINVLVVGVIFYATNTLHDLQTSQQLLQASQQLINQEMADRHEHYVQRQNQIDKELDDHENRIRGVENKTARMP